eukprot:Gb_40554 [translate_table: standard]
MEVMNNIILSVIFAFVLNGFYQWQHVSSANVTYDHRSIVINGQRRVLISGSIHYPRSTPEMWPDLIQKSKDGGLDVIETYVFWDLHEPVQGRYDFEGRLDLVKFVKTVQQAGLLVHLRIGPYFGFCIMERVLPRNSSGCFSFVKITLAQLPKRLSPCGFPLWLHFIPGIKFRTDNEPFKVGHCFLDFICNTEMQRFTALIVNLMKQKELFASQGGPIILSQVIFLSLDNHSASFLKGFDIVFSPIIENEYGNIDSAYGAAAQSYIKWAASMAVGMNTGVPWVMCQQADAPDPIINTCNGFYCDQFKPNSYKKPKMWTENWTGWFLSFGGSVPSRPVEDIAFAVARFFERGGTFQNYYMYHGGTNFGRASGGPFIATSYDYDAPIDEYECALASVHIST